MKTQLPSGALRVSVILLTSAFVLLLGVAQSTYAADATWNVNAAGPWATGTNWNPAASPGATSGTSSTDIATFGFALTADRIVTVDASRNIGGITFSGTAAFKYTLSGGDLLLSNGGVIQTAAANGSHTDTISTPIAIQGDGGAATFTAGATSASSLLSIGAVTGVSTGTNVTTLTLNGANTGANAVTGIIGNGSGGGKLAIAKSGTGAWTLSGVNTFTGGVTLAAGTLNINNASALGGTAGTFTINGGTIDNTSAASITNSQNNAITVGANFTFTGTQDLNLGTGDVTMAATRQITVTGAGSNLTLGGAIQSTTAGLTKTGSGTLVLSGTNAYSGITTVSAGVLKFTKIAALGSGSSSYWTSGNLVASSGAMMAFNVGGAGEFSTGDIDTIAATTGIASGAIIGLDTTNNGGDLSYTPTLLAGRGIGKLGTGNWTFSGTTTGPIVVDQGLLTLAVDNTGVTALKFGAVNGSPNVGTLDMSAGNVTATSLTVQTNSTGTNAVTLGAGRTLTVNGGVTVNTTGVNGTRGANLTFNPGGPVTSSTFTMTGANTFLVGQDSPTGTTTRTGVVDMRNLGVFNAGTSATALANFVVGNYTQASGANYNDGGIYKLYLAPSSTIYTTALSIGKKTTGAAGQFDNTLFLGSGTTGIHATTITVGETGNVSTGSTIKWDTGVTGGAVTLNGTGAVAAVTNMYVGYKTDTSSASAGARLGTVDLSNGTVTGNITNVYVGYKPGNDSGTSNPVTTGVFKIGAGAAGASSNLTIGTLTLASSGQASSTRNNPVNGTFQLDGGNVSVTNNIVLTNENAYDQRNGTLTINSGTLTVGGNITSGTTRATSVLNLSGGTLDMTGGAIGTSGSTVTTLNFQSGTLKNVSQINNGAGLTKSGTGTLILDGTNTYTGTNTINGGTIRITSTSSLGSVANNLTMGGGTLDLETFSQTVGAVSITAAAANGNTIQNGTLTGSSYAVSNTTGNVIVSANLLANGSAGLTKSGSGTLTLSGSNTYTGATAINGGTVQISASNNLGDSSSATNTISMNTGTLRSTANSYDLGVNRAITLSGPGTIQSDAGTLTVSGEIANGANKLTLLGDGNIVIGGVIGSGATPTGALDIGSSSIGANVTLSGSNLFTGNVSLPATNTQPRAILTITNSGALGVGPKTVSSTGGNGVNNGGEIHLQNDITLASNISFTTSGFAIYNDSGNNTINGNFTMASGNGNTILTSNSGSLTLNGNFTPNTTGRNLDLRGNGDGLISGVIANGSTAALQVFKNAGSGTWTLSGSNTYTGGTIVGAGTLMIGAGGSLGSTNGPLTVNGGTLDLNGSNLGVGNFTGTGGMIVNNATGTAQTLTIGNNNGTGGNYQGVIANNTSGTGTIRLIKVGTGTLTLSGTNTFTGGVVIQGGTLSVSVIGLAGASGNLGAAAQGTASSAPIQFTTNNSKGLEYTGAGETSNRNLYLDTQIGSTAGTILANGSGALTLSGTITQNASNSSVGTAFVVLSGTNTGDNTLSGPWTDNSRSMLRKTDVGTWSLVGARSYSGPTDVQNGILKFDSIANAGVASSLGRATTQVVGGAGNNVAYWISLGTASTAGTLEFTGTAANSSNRAVGLNGNGVLSTGSASGTLALSGSTFNLAATGTNTLTLGGANTGANTLSGVIADGTAGGKVALTKADAGTWTLSGSNTYTGLTTVSAGTLNFDVSETLTGGLNVLTSGTAVLTAHLGGAANVKVLDISSLNISGTNAFAGGGGKDLGGLAPAPVPEPGTIGLLAAGAIGGLLLRRRNRKSGNR